ncbi:MAG TPA: Flp family type IVb pilin [Xanthobacteraceae bacterium]|jgi:pilus assembly protein Flp/PilA|nr:Flp family type IVb pilin [Xanthobacteraceae bacterium]
MRGHVKHRSRHGLDLWARPSVLLTAFLRERSAATAIEYSIIAAGVALVIVAVVSGIGTTVQGTFTTVQTGLK